MSETNSTDQAVTCST